MHSPPPTKTLTVTITCVALALTSAFGDPSAVLTKAIKSRKGIPAIPNSVNCCLIQVKASAWAFGAFCFVMGSYASIVSLIVS